MPADKEEINDQHEIGGNEEFVRAQKSKELDNIIILFTDMILQEMKYPRVKGGLFQDKDTPGHKNEDH
jgi:hypothetical protein